MITLTKVTISSIRSLASLTFILGILITYLNKALIFTPSDKSWISLPSIPYNPREWFTLTENVICGGVFPGTSRSCLQLSESGGGWKDYSTELLEPRISSVSWDSPLGIILMGGYGRSGDTTELVTSSGTSNSFRLKYDLRLDRYL